MKNTGHTSGGRAADTNRSNVSNGLVVNLFVDHSIVVEREASRLGSALSLECLCPGLIVAEKVVDTSKVEAARNGQCDWRSVN